MVPNGIYHWPEGGEQERSAPVIARIAKEMDILTVGIVTIPFIFEGEKKIIQALDGVERIAQHVDALLVINNELPERNLFRPYFYECVRKSG